MEALINDATIFDALLLLAIRSVRPRAIEAIRSLNKRPSEQ